MNNTNARIQELEFSTTVTELRLVLGLCNFFRRFPLSFARLPVTLNWKHFEGQRLTFDQLRADEVTARETFKAKLVEHPVLALSLLIGAYTVGTDACNKQIGYVLLQN